MQYAAGMIVAKQAFFDEKLAVGKAFKEALRAVPRMLTAALAVMLVYVPVVAIMCGVAVLAALALESFSIYTLSVTGLMAFILMIMAAGLVVIFIFVMVGAFVCMTIPVSLFEKRYGFGALGKSIQLVKTAYFKIIGILILSTLMMMGIQYSLTGIFDVIMMFIPYAASFLSLEAVFVLTALSYIGMLVGMAVVLLITPLGVIFVAVLYLNQRVQHDGLDIEVGLEKLSATKGWTI